MSLHSDHFGVYCVCSPDYEEPIPQLPASESLTDTDDTLTSITWLWDAIPGATNYVLEVSASAGFGTILATYSGPLLTYNATGLTPDTTYYARVKGQAVGYIDSPWIADSGITDVPALLTALFGWADTNSVSSTLITESDGFVDFYAGANAIPADFRPNTDPKWLYILIPIGEPLKTKWYGSTLNQGDISIADDSETFRYRGTVASGGDSYDVYMSTFATEQTDTVIEFRTV